MMSDFRSKSMDIPRTTLFAFQTRSSAILIDELRRIEKDEQELNILNNRFAIYLNTISNLGEMNIKLRRQIDEIHRNYMRDNYQKEWNQIRRELNQQLRNSVAVQTRVHRADYEKKYYKNLLNSLSTSDQLLLVQQQFNVNSMELNFLKEQYAKQTEELRFYKNQYNEYTTTLIEYTDEYNRILSERLQSEHSCYTLEEQISFEREYNRRCKEEFELLERIEYDLNDQFTKKEFEKIIGQIREDYQNYHEIQLTEWEIFYEAKLEIIKNDFQEEDEEQENIQPLIEENRILQEKFKQLQSDLRHLTEQNQQQYEGLNNQYHQLEQQIPEYESSIEISRHTTVHLTSEINTYRCLLTNLVQKPKPPKSKPIDFTVHFGNGIIWCRI